MILEDVHSAEKVDQEEVPHLVNNLTFLFPFPDFNLRLCFMLSKCMTFLCSEGLGQPRWSPSFFISRTDSRRLLQERKTHLKFNYLVLLS